MYVEYTYYEIAQYDSTRTVLHYIADSYGSHTYRPYCVHFPPKQRTLTAATSGNKGRLKRNKNRRLLTEELDRCF